MAEWSPATKRMKVWNQGGPSPTDRHTVKKEIVMENGNILKSCNTWPELEEYL